MAKRDYTGAYVRYVAGIRTTPPSPRAYDLTPQQAAAKRRDTDAALARIRERSAVRILRPYADTDG